MKLNGIYDGLFDLCARHLAENQIYMNYELF